jgi:SPP1 family predicted phage head-tail adaptor
MTTKPRIYAYPRGQLDRRVTLWRPTATAEDTDDHGHPVDAWEEVATVWAQVTPLRGRWAELAHQLYPTATWRVIINYRSAVAHHWKLTFRDVTLIVGHVTDIENRGHTLELLCTEQ